MVGCMSWFNYEQTESQEARRSEIELIEGIRSASSFFLLCSFEVSSDYRERKMVEKQHQEAPLSAPPSDSNSAIKRYAPPNQRNRSTNRRKSSSDRLDRTNSAGSDLDKNQVASLRNAQLPDQGDAGSNNLLNENHYPRFVALEGCSCSAASQLLTDRWTAAMQSYNNPKDSSEKPVMYSGGTSSAWTQLRLPHQIMSPAASASSSVPQLDFLGELRRQMQC